MAHVRAGCLRAGRCDMAHPEGTSPMVRPRVPAHDQRMDPSAPPAPPPAEAPGPPPRRLRLRRARSTTSDGAGGIGCWAASRRGSRRTYGWDVTLVRLAFVVAALVGIGVPAYVVAWVVIPPDPDDGAEVEPRERGALVGLVLLGIGVLWLGGRIFPSGGDVVRLAWPLALVAGGIAVLVLRSGSSDHVDVEDPGGSGPERGEPDEGGPSVATSTLAPELGPPAPAVPPTSSAWTQPQPWPAGAVTAPPRPPKVPRAPKPRRAKAPHPSPWLAPLTVSVLVLGAGLAALLDTIGVLDVDIEVAGAIALGVVAATLILSAWYGRALGLVSLAVLLTVVCGVAAIVDTPFKGGVGDRSYLPVSVRASSSRSTGSRSATCASTSARSRSRPGRRP